MTKFTRLPLPEREEYISRDDLEVDVITDLDTNEVFVRFAGFETLEDASEYAEFLQDTLPLLLFYTTKLQ